MSGFASSIEYIDGGYTVSFEEEAAGKVGRYLGVIAAVIVPFAAPWAFGAIAASGALGGGLASAAAAGTIGTMTNVLGSAAVGALMNAGAAYAGGARGGAVWQAAGMGAISGGGGAFARGLGAGTGAAGAANTTGAAAAVPGTTAATTGGIISEAGATGAGAGLNAIGGVGPVSLAPPAAGGVSSSIMNGIRGIFGQVSGQTMNRIGAAIINAAVNGQSMGRLDGLVAQQRAELQALAARDRVAYQQRISTAQTILADADRMDPAWVARTRMADVAGMEANEFQQAMRNIATRQGGSLDAGQRKAYERGQSLHTARSKALAYNQGFTQAQGVQNQIRAQGAQLLGPDTAGFQNWQAGTELAAAQERAHREADNSTWGGFGAALFERDHPAATSPDPSNTGDNEDNSGFFAGLRNPFGGNG